MTTETMADFSRRLGVARSTITRAVAAGRVLLDESGHVLIEQSLQRWHSTRGGRTDMQALHAAHRGAHIPQAGVSPTPAPENATSPATDGNSGAEATRAQLKEAVLRFENNTIKLEMALRRHHRYQRQAVQREAHALGSTLRAAVERLVDELAPQLAMRTNPTERRRLLAIEIKQLTRLIKAEQLRAMRRLREPVDAN
jgi:exonuclease VII small subunit